MKIVITILFLFFSSSVVGENIGGSAWILNFDDDHKAVMLFEKDLTFTYQLLKSSSGNKGEVFSDKRDTWFQKGSLITISFTDGYMLVSLKINEIGNKMYGSSINKEGRKSIVEGHKID